MKRLVVFFVGLHMLTPAVYSKSCIDFLTPLEARFYKQMQRQIHSLSEKDRQVLETLIYLHLGHVNLHEFMNRGFLDFQFYSMPNYFRANRGNDLHYKLMMHYIDSTQTLIYNSRTTEIAERSTRVND